MFDKIKYLWSIDPFLLLCLVCLIFIIGYGIVNIMTQKQGKWSRTYYVNDTYKSDNVVRPKEKDSKGERECRRVLESIFNIRKVSKCMVTF